MVGNTTIQRPSSAILNSGLSFDHFKAPFTMTRPLGGPVEGFISVGDALDYAVCAFRNSGGRNSYTVLDAVGELVYTVE